MEVKNIEKKDGHLHFQVVIDAVAFDNALSAVYRKNRSRIMVPGFRKGKAPRKVVEGMYGADVFYDDAVSDLAPDAYDAGVKEAGDRVVGKPSMTDFNVGDDKSLTLDYKVALYPEAELGQYKELTVYRPSVEVTDEEIAEELTRVQKRNGRILTVERPAKDGDTVNIDYDGYRDGVRFDGGKDEGHDLVLGSNSFVPGFEEQLVGMSAGEEKDIDITFPEQYHAADLAGAAVVFKVKVNQVKETQLPELDDDFAKDVSEFDTLDEYKDDIRANILKRKQEEADNEFHRAALEKAADNMTVEVPQEMLEDQLDIMFDEYRRNIMMQGMSFEQYAAMMGMNEMGFRNMLRPSAVRQTNNEILLEAVADAEGIVPTAEEIEEDYNKAAENYEMELDKVKEVIPEDIIVRDIKMRKAADIIYNSAVATDIKPEDEEKSDGEAGDWVKDEAAEQPGDDAPAQEHPAEPAAEAPAEDWVREEPAE